MILKGLSTCNFFQGIDAATYNLIIKDSEKWVGKSSFNEWISAVTCLIIEGGCGSEIITSLLPICKIKVSVLSFSFLYVTFYLFFTLHTIQELLWLKNCWRQKNHQFLEIGASLNTSKFVWE